MFFEGEPSKITFVGGIGGAGEVNLVEFFGVLTLSREPSIPGSAFFHKRKIQTDGVKIKVKCCSKAQTKIFQDLFFH